MTSWIGIDGGQSGTRLVTSDGRSGCGRGFVHGGDPVGVNLGLIREALGDAGVGGPFETACLGLTGMPGDPVLRDELAAAVVELLGVRELRLSGDCVTAHAGALPGGYGVVVAAGTGMIAFALGDRVSHVVDGAGYLFGDDGGCFSIGRAAVAAAVRAADGRGPATKLEVPDLAGLYTSPAAVAEVAALTPHVFAVAAEGDAVARSIVDWAVDQLAHTITIAVRTLPAGEVPVAYTGGLFRAGEQLLAPLRAAVAVRAPQARLLPAAGPPLAGAARLASGPLGPYENAVQVYGRGR
ncbi:BadF/BadG/BcrA/BcrD ATPase family protein [Streptomyces sp. NPDC051940]|uniref:N-acetylglucosamine kinase n=1 Tax=Streptomyces sp. NPDC051940 TaxID=3155675 RepID=UPI00343094BF